MIQSFKLVLPIQTRCDDKSNNNHLIWHYCSQAWISWGRKQNCMKISMFWMTNTNNPNVIKMCCIPSSISISIHHIEAADGQRPVGANPISIKTLIFTPLRMEFPQWFWADLFYPILDYRNNPLKSYPQYWECALAKEIVSAILL